MSQLILADGTPLRSASWSFPLRPPDYQGQVEGQATFSTTSCPV